MMKVENYYVLEKHKIHWHTLRDARFVTDLEKSIAKDLEAVYREEIDKDFTVNHWCNNCISEMIKILYLATKFDAVEAEFINSKTRLIETDNGDIVNVNGDVIRITKKRGRKPKSR